jgi:CubicO group peptidase (beta-lactamase class C family)
MRVAGTLFGLLLLLTHVVAGRQSDAIEAMIRRQMAAQQIPGLAVAVIRKGEIVRAQGDVHPPRAG